jgi:8-amino-7-oxononanoate synthase
MTWQHRLTQRLADVRSAGLWRDRPLLTSAPASQVQVNGKLLTSFASNDYLGLAADETIAHDATLLNAQAGWGGSTASHTLAGHHLPHHLLEDELADWLGTERALLFSSGYLANLAVQTAFVQQGDRIIHDKLNHASLIDGAVLSGVDFKRYPHNDMTALARRLGQAHDGLTMVVTDGVFSMDGDLVNLPELVRVTDGTDRLLVVDEAHSFGVLGEQGRGTFSHHGLQADALTLRVGTLGKAFGSSGAFIAGSGLLIDTIAQFARSYRYTTAQPPYQASFTRAALRRVQQGDDLRSHLNLLIDHFRQGATALGLTLMPSLTPIQPILLHDNTRAMRWQQQLWELGFWVPAIRPPTIPEGTARLRLSICANHNIEQIDALLQALVVCQQQEQAC